MERTVEMPGRPEAGSTARVFLSGVRAALSLAVPALPIGVLLGFAIRESAVVSNLAGWSSSWLVFAGAAQFAAIELLDQGAGVFAVVAAVFMINARHLMYSAALSGRYRSAPTWFKVVGSYFLIDQVFALNGDHISSGRDDRHISHRMAYYLGSALPMASVWLVGVASGIGLGQFIPASWEIEFAIPLMFLGLLILSTSNLPGVVAAVIGASVAVVGRDWPSGSGLLTGAVLGVVVAGTMDWYGVGSSPGPDEQQPASAGEDGRQAENSECQS